MRQESTLAALLIGTLAVSALGADPVSEPATSTVVVYPAPQGSPVSTDYAVTVEGKDSAVYGVPSKYKTPACFSYFDTTGPVTIDVTVKFLPGDKIADVSVHPLALGIVAKRDGNRITFKAPGPGNITLLVNGDYKNRPLHLFINPPVEAPPKDAIYFGPGKHVLGYDKPITLTNGTTLYIAGGAWVEGVIRAQDARNIRVVGRGVLCQNTTQGKDYNGADNAPPGIAFANCQDVVMEGIIETRSVIGWCSLASNCDRIALRGYRVLAPVVWSTDGFNPCNCRDVTIEGCFFRTGDDCIAIKGNTGGNVLTEPHIPPSTQPPVENISISNCVFWNDHNEVIAIGCETRAKYIRNIQIRDCDVLFHGHSENLGVFGILPLHGTEISKIVYENIRVEHCEEKLFCFRFLNKIWGIPGDQSFPGTITDVTIRNISVRNQVGGPRSEFSGWATDKQITNVSISGVRYGSKLVVKAEDMGLSCNSHVSDVRFGGGTPSKVAPQNLQAKAVSDRQIELTWAPVVGDPEGAIEWYVVHRDGAKIGETPDPAFSDTGLREKTAYTYEIAAVNASVKEGPKSASVTVTTPPDTTPPAVVAAWALPGENPRVGILFSEPVNKSTAEQAANYSIDKGVTVKAAALNPDTRTVTLSVDKLVRDTAYAILVSRVRDVAATPNMIAPNSRGTFSWLSGLVAHWALREGSATTVADFSGENNNGQIKGRIEWISASKGGGLRLEPDSYVEIPNSATLEKVQDDSYTLCAWFTPLSVPPGVAADANNAAHGIMIKAGYHLGLNYNHGRKYSMIHWLQGNQTVVASSAGTFDPGKRCHVAGVVDRAAGVVRLYVNGKLEGESRFAANAPARPYEPTPWRLGIAKPGSQDFRWPAHGVLDGAQIYKGALTANEVQSLGRTARSGPEQPEDGGGGHEDGRAADQQSN
jgi:hypothetical protein